MRNNDNKTYTFDFVGVEHYKVKISQITGMYRLFFENGKFITGSIFAILEAKEQLAHHPFRKYEEGLLFEWLYEMITLVIK